MKTILLKIKGMHCENCETQIEHHLKGLNGVQDAKADVMSHTAKVTLDEKLCGVKEVTSLIEQVGFQVDGFQPVAHP